MSFGQRFKITPIQMATAVCAVANNGVLIKPRIVKEIKNTDTGAITTINTLCSKTSNIKNNCRDNDGSFRDCCD